MVISDNGASAEGGVTGSFNEMRFFNQVPESFEDNLAHIDELGGPAALQPLPVGLGLGGRHAVPALEARDLPRRLDRPVHPVAGRTASRPAARCACSTRTRSTWSRPCSTCSAIEPPERIRGVAQSPLEGVSFAHTFDDARRPRPSTPRSTSRCSATARSTTTTGARCARGRGRLHDGGQAGRKFGDPITPEILEELDRSGWELYDMATDPTEADNVAGRAPGSAARADRALVGGGREVQGAAARRRRRRRGSRRSARRPPSRARATSTTPAGRSVPAFAAPLVYNRPYSIEADVEIPDGGAEGVLLAQGGDAGGYTSTSRTAAALPLQLRRPRPLRGAVGRDGSPQAGTRCATSSSRPAQPDIANGKGAPGRGAALHRRRARRRDRVPAHDAARSSSSKGSAAASTSGPRRRSTQPPFPLHRHDPTRSRSTSPAS